MNIPIKNCLFLVAGFLASCTANFSSTPYRSVPVGLAPNGVVYKLPNTIFTYQVTYALYQRRVGTKVDHFVWLDGQLDNDENIESPVTLSPKVVGDDFAVFVIDTGDLASANVVTKSSKFSLSDDGLITGANAEFEDKTMEIIQSAVGTGLKIAKIAAFPGSTGRTAASREETTSTTKLASIPVTGTFSYSSMRKSANRRYHTVPTAALKKQFAIITGIGSIEVPPLTFGMTSSTSTITSPN